MAPDQISQESSQESNPSSSTRTNYVLRINRNAAPDLVLPINLFQSRGDPSSSSTNTPQHNDDFASFGDPSSSSSTNVAQPNNAIENLDLTRYLPLYRAALKGDWEEAKRFLDNDPSAISAIITDFSMTALHVAAFEGHSEFVENIVRLMQAKDLELPDNSGCTALHYAASTGRLGAARSLVQKNPALTNITDKDKFTPLLLAAAFGSECKDLVWYLYLATTDEDPSRPFTGPKAAELVGMLILSGCLDVLLNLLHRHPRMIDAKTLLSLMVNTPTNFLSGTRLGFWESCVYSLIPIQRSIESIVDNPNQGSQNISGVPSAPTQRADPVLYCFPFLQRLLLNAFRQITPRCIKRLQDAKLRHHCAVEIVKRVCEEEICTTHDPAILIRAARNGIVEMFQIYFQFCPDLIRRSPKENSLPLVAIQHRQEQIFNLFCEKNARNMLLFSALVPNSGTILHLAANMAPFYQISSVSGAALQMQKEIQWFKAVEKLVHPVLVDYQNEDGKTARELFTQEHKALAEAGEKWMKDTSNSCMIVSTLIATFVFAAAFTVPGGTNSDGTPNFLWTKSFMVFAVSDALSLFSSITSLLMFLSILTARFAEEDFLKSLPKKLILGLACLFFAIATMMAAFGATLYIVLSKRLKWISAPITLLTAFPVAIFVLQQLPLFIEMFRSTFGFNFRRQSFW